MGRPKTPTAKLKVTGQYRTDRHGDREHEPRPEGSPQKPKRLKGEAAEFWDRTVPDLASVGIAKRVDSEQLARMSEWHASYVEALESDCDPYRRIVMKACCQKQFNAIASKFGLTPVDRAQLSVEPIRKDDPFEQFLKARLTK